MKKLLFWMVLIVGIVALIGSCAKKDDSKATTPSTTATSTTTSITTTTPSGSITLGSYTVSGVYKSGCYTSNLSALIAAKQFPTDVQSYGFAFVVTGNDNFTTETHSYTDTGCTTSSWVNKLVRDNVTVGTASGSNYPVTYNDQTKALTVHTTAAETTTETLYSNTLDWTVGTPRVLSQSGQFKYGLWTLSGTTWYEGSDSTSATPTSAGTVPYVKQ